MDPDKIALSIELSSNFKLATIGRLFSLVTICPKESIPANINYFRFVIVFIEGDLFVVAIRLPNYPSEMIDKCVTSPAISGP